MTPPAWSRQCMLKRVTLVAMAGPAEVVAWMGQLLQQGAPKESAEAVGQVGKRLKALSKVEGGTDTAKGLLLLLESATKFLHAATIQEAEPSISRSR